jgi:hypothetical protein
MHTINLYDVPMVFPAFDVHHDLLSGRYVAGGLRDRDKPFYERIKRTEANFTPDALRGLGTR